MRRTFAILCLLVSLVFLSCQIFQNDENDDQENLKTGENSEYYWYSESVRTLPRNDAVLYPGTGYEIDKSTGYIRLIPQENCMIVHFSNFSGNKETLWRRDYATVEYRMSYEDFDTEIVLRRVWK